MEYIEKKEFSIDDFNAWGGALNTIEEIKGMGAKVKYTAENFIKYKFLGVENVSHDDINNLLWFGMDDFIKGMQKQLDDELLEYFEYTGVINGVLYAVKHGNTLKLVTEVEEANDYVIRYDNLDRASVWTEKDNLYIQNDYIKQTNVYKVIDDKLILESTY